MKRTLQSCFLLLTFGCAFAHAQPTVRDRVPGKPAELELQKAIDKYYQAFYAGDVETVKRMTRNDYLQTDVNGIVQDKTAWLSEYYLPMAKRMKGGVVRLDPPQPDDVRTLRYGNVAVVTGRTSLKSSVVSGQGNVRVLRYTQVWVKSRGEWQRAVYHNAWMPEPSPSSPPK